MIKDGGPVPGSLVVYRQFSRRLIMLHPKPVNGPANIAQMRADEIAKN